MESITERIDFKKYSKSENISEENEEILDEIPDSIYCDLVTTLNEKCIQSSLLEIWKFKEDLINTATQQEIVDAVNLLARSPWYGYDVDFESLLGGIVLNSTGHIVSARTLKIAYVIQVPKDGRVHAGEGIIVREVADQISLDWELKFINIALNSTTEKMKVYVRASRSLGDVASTATNVDKPLFAGAYVIMLVYTIIMLGRLNRLEVRLFLTISGIVSIAMGMIIAVGISSLFGYPYTPVHSILPFLCLGKLCH